MHGYQTLKKTFSMFHLPPFFFLFLLYFMSEYSRNSLVGGGGAVRDRNKGDAERRGENVHTAEGNKAGKPRWW